MRTNEDSYSVLSWLLEVPEDSCKKFARILEMPGLCYKDIGNITMADAMKILIELRGIYEGYNEDLCEFLRERGPDPVDEPKCFEP